MQASADARVFLTGVNVRVLHVIIEISPMRVLRADFTVNEDPPLVRSS